MLYTSFIFCTEFSAPSNRRPSNDWRWNSSSSNPNVNL